MEDYPFVYYLLRANGRGKFHAVCVDTCPAEIKSSFSCHGTTTINKSVCKNNVLQERRRELTASTVGGSEGKTAAAPNVEVRYKTERVEKRVGLKNPSTSSDSDPAFRKAENGMDGDPSTYFETGTLAAQEYWTSEFPAAPNEVGVSRVRILSSPTDESSLALSRVEVDGELCGYLPSETVAEQWYDV